jgi:signal transduction histidine kinase
MLNTSYTNHSWPIVSEEAEINRQRALKQYSISDAGMEISFEEIAEIAADSCKVPVVTISMIDHDTQWILAAHGTDIRKLPRHQSLCALTLGSPFKSIVIADLKTDERLRNHHLAAQEGGYRFFAGFPITSHEGYSIGALSVFDYQPRELDKTQLRMLKMLANQLMNTIELTSKVYQLEKTQQKLEVANHDLARFAHVVAHDIRSPLKNIYSLAQLLEKDEDLSEDSQKMIDFIQHSAKELEHLVEGILEYSLAGKNGVNKQLVNLEAIVDNVIELLQPTPEVHINLQHKAGKVVSDATLLRQILLNLVTNAIRYNNKQNTQIEIRTELNGNHWLLLVSDNGPGIEDHLKKQIFEPYKVLTESDRFGKRGSGIGLATVKSLTEKLGGKITVESTPGAGSTFVLNFPA